MSDFTYKDFQEVAKEVAEHISPKTGIKLEKSWDCSQDCMWEAKSSYVDEVLSRFTRVVRIFGDERMKWKKKSELIINLEHPSSSRPPEYCETFFWVEPKPPAERSRTIEGPI